MHVVLASYCLALLAGLVSTLSPCVLPIVPILLGSAMNAHRRAPIALAAGLAISYATIGTALAWAGTAIELNSELVRRMGAALLGLFALVILSSSLQQRFAAATSGIGNTGNRLLLRLHLGGLYGQFVVGLVLGMIWSPCVGPTLGAAIVLASHGKHLGGSATLMGLFSVGAALPIVILGYISRSTMMSIRGGLLQVGRAGKVALGSAMLLIAIATISGRDKQAEAWLVNHSPAWLTSLSTRF
ncbi:MAG TPA: cytochrome c biogenesis CcdA family protein [Terracidiphilus sp.]|jgi:cytochrome c biogenesis protein CcdA